MMKSAGSHNTTANSGPKNRRKNYIVNAAFQWRYAITIGLTVFFITSTMSSVLYTVLHHQARQRLIHPETYTGEVALVVLFAAIAFSAVTAGGVAIWSLIATHRMCGPLFVLERYLTELAEGRLPTLRPLRRKDEFKDLYRGFSRAIETLKARKQADLTVLAEALGSAKSALKGDDESRRRELESLVLHMEKMHKAVAEDLGGEANGELEPPATRVRSATGTPVTVT